jgi:hypothetical protein
MTGQDTMNEDRPLFAHPRLIAAGLIAVLALATGGALYVRPLSGETQAARMQGGAIVRVSLQATDH